MIERHQPWRGRHWPWGARWLMLVLILLVTVFAFRQAWQRQRLALAVAAPFDVVFAAYRDAAPWALVLERQYDPPLTLATMPTYAACTAQRANESIVSSAPQAVLHALHCQSTAPWWYRVWAAGRTLLAPTTAPHATPEPTTTP